MKVSPSRLAGDTPKLETLLQYVKNHKMSGRSPATCANIRLESGDSTSDSDIDGTDRELTAQFRSGRRAPPNSVSLLCLFQPKARETVPLYVDFSQYAILVAES